MKTIHTPISLTNENSQKCVVIANNAPQNNVVVVHDASLNIVVLASEGTALGVSEATPSLNRSKHLLLLLLFITHISFAGTFTWTGATNTDWATASNWSGNISGHPSTNDTVSIITQTNLPVLAANTTIKKFTMTSGTLDCNGYTLTISATATFNGGTINNGTLTCSGTSTLTFAGTTFGVVINATGNNILFNGSVFNSTVTAVKKGSSNDNSIGNNVFNGVVTLTDSGSGSLVLSNTTSAPDTFNSTLTVSATSTGAVYLAHQGTGNVFNGDVTFSTGNVFSNTYGTAAYNGNITLNSASANISFGNSTGSWSLASGKNISIGTFSAGTLTIRNLTQSDNSINMRLALTGTGKLVLGNNSISAKLYASSNQLTFSATRFLSADTLIYTGGNNATSAGGNYFGSTVYIANTYTGTNYHFTLGSSSVDTFTTTTTIATTGNTSLDVANGLFLGAVTLRNSSTGTLSDRLFIWDCTFKGALTLDGIHSAIKFKNGTGNSLIDSSATLSLVSGYAGQLTLSYIEQRGSNAINLNMSTNTSTGNNTILTIGPNATFNANFSYLGQRLELNGGTFNGSASFTRFSQQLDVCEGGNVFNGVTQICDSVAATTANRVFKLANTNPDDFNGNVTFKQYGTGSGASTMKMYPAHTANSTFAGNVTVESNNVPIEFGANGGKVIFDGGKAQSITKSGSYVPSFKNLEINSSRGEVSLGYPLTLADTLFLTNGVLSTDATNLITLADNAKVSGGSDSSYINGPIKKIGNDAFTFPLGDISLTSGAFHALEITAPSTTGAAYTAQYFASEQTFGSSKVDSIGYLSTCEYWTLDRNADTCQVKPTIWWNSNSCNIDTGLQRVAYWNSSQWVSLEKGAVSGNSAKGSVASATKVDLFGKFTLAQVCNMTADISSSHGGTICAGVTDTITAIPSGQTSYQFFKNGTSIQTGSSNKYISSTLSNGDVIKVKVTNVGSCFSYDSLTMVVNSLPSVSITTDSTTFCKGQTHTLTASGTGLTSYLWSPGGATTSSRTVNAAGTYSVTASNGSCSNSASQVIALYDTVQPTITVIGRTTICTGTTSELYAELTGAVNYLWSTSETTQLITVEDSAIYQITCLDAHGCNVHNWQAMTQANNPTAPIISPTGIVNLCSSDSGITNTSVTLHTTNYSTDLTWSSSEITQDIVVDYEDNFNVTYTDPTSGCSSVSNTASTIVSAYSVLPSSITTNKTGNEVCKGDSITLTENSGVLGYPIYEGDSTSPTYWSWYIGACGDSLIGTGTSIIVHPTKDTKYYLRAEGPCGTVCDSILVKCMSIYVSAINVRCFGGNNGSALIHANGGSKPYIYTWSESLGDGVKVRDLKAGLYSITVEDSLGCAQTDSVVITQPSPILLSLMTTPSTCEDSVGIATITATGGIEPYSYLWSDYGGTDSIADSLVAGVYLIVVSDSGGCVRDTIVPVSNSDGPVLVTTLLSNVTCAGAGDGSAKVHATLGTAPYSYHWYPSNETDSIAKSLKGGIQVIKVTDNMGCVSLTLDTIEDPDPMVLIISKTSSHCDSSGSATAHVSGGVPPYTFYWSSGGTDSIEADIAAGLDSVFVTDNRGCQKFAVVMIADSVNISINKSVTHANCFGDTSGSAIITVSGGSSPFSFKWFPNEDTVAAVTGLQAGQYSVVVVDSSGCKVTDTITVNSPPPFHASIYATDASSDSTADGIAGVIAVGGTLPYSYLWSPDSLMTPTIEGLGYLSVDSVIVTDANGCKTGPYGVRILISGTCPQSDCYSSALCSNGGYPIPNPNGPAITLNLVDDFFADNTGATSSQCAFEAAADFFNVNGHSGNDVNKLIIPYGIYKVGLQDHTYNPNNPQILQYTGHSVMCLNNIHDFRIEGQVKIVGADTLHTIIKYDDCLKYGTFDEATGKRYVHSTECYDNNDQNCPDASNPDPACLCHNLGTYNDRKYAADIKNFLVLTNCQNITVKDLELNGNSDNMSVGGYFSIDADGIQLPHDAIVLHSCYNVWIDNINAHHFGRDGIGIFDDGCPRLNSAMYIHVLNSKFNWNGRCGMDWGGGDWVLVSNCEFNYTGMGRFGSKAMDGLDIELAHGNAPIQNGFFYTSRFMFNGVAGVENNANSSGTANLSQHFSFYSCTFVSGESGWAVEPNSRDFGFYNCSFYGNVGLVYDCWAFPGPIDNCKFDGCFFYDEYPWVYPWNGHNCDVFSHNQNEGAVVDECPGCSQVNCSSAGALDLNRTALLNLYNASKANFVNCIIKTNFSSYLCYLSGGDPATYVPGSNTIFHSWPADNINLTSCHFLSYGQNACPCDVHNVIFNYSTFINASNDLKFTSTLINDYSCGTYYTIGNSNGVIFSFPDNISNPAYNLTHDHCVPKYRNPSYPNKVNIYTSACDAPNGCFELLDEFCPALCYPPCNQKKAEPTSTINLPVIFPSPASNQITISGMEKGSRIAIFNIIGECVKKANAFDSVQTLDIDQLPVGIYFIKINELSIARFIKLN